jgi:hypothetical protein
MVIMRIGAYRITNQDATVDCRTRPMTFMGAGLGRCTAEDRPSLAWQQLRQGGQHHPINGLIARSGDLPAYHHQLMSQHRDFEIFRIRRTAQTNQPERTAHDQEAKVRTTAAGSLPDRHRRCSRPEPRTGTPDAW